MNIHCLRNPIPVIMVSFLLFSSCGDSSLENSTATTATSTDQSPLIVPDNPVPASGAADTATTLFNIWVLDSINHKVPDSGYFALGSPYFDFNEAKKTISGFTGCNGINGKFDARGQRLIFDSIVVSAQECRGGGKEFERKLLSGFRSGRTTYRIQNGILYLSVDAGSVFALRRIRNE